MGKYDYDLIGVSKKDNIDLLIEIKYWKYAPVACRMLANTCQRLNDACENYQTIAHRDSSGMVFVVIPDDQFDKEESVIERNMQNALYGIRKKVAVKCVGESLVR